MKPKIVYAWQSPDGKWRLTRDLRRDGPANVYETQEALLAEVRQRGLVVEWHGPTPE